MHKHFMFMVLKYVFINICDALYFLLSMPSQKQNLTFLHLILMLVHLGLVTLLVDAHRIPRPVGIIVLPMLAALLQQDTTKLQILYRLSQKKTQKSNGARKMGTSRIDHVYELPLPHRATSRQFIRRENLNNSI